MEDTKIKKKTCAKKTITSLPHKSPAKNNHPTLQIKTTQQKAK